MATVFFRYDDYSELSSWPVDRGLIEVFSRARLSCTFAVIPAVTAAYPAAIGRDEDLPLVGERAELLRQAVVDGVVDLALHGWNHRPNSFSPLANPSECRGLPLDHQVDILRRGKQFLFDVTGVMPKVFVPPWNTYDANTLKALGAVGIPGISANRYAPPPEGEAGPQFAPMTIEIGRLRTAVEEARDNSSCDAVVGVMMHPYDFHESGDSRSRLSLAEFEQELAWLASQPDVRVMPISALLEADSSMDAARFKANRPSKLENLFPPFVPTAGSDMVYLQTGPAHWRKRRREAMAVGFFAAVVLAAGGAGWWAQQVLNTWSGWAALGVALLVLLAGAGLAARSIRNQAIYFRAAAVLSALLGFGAGLIA